MTSLEELKNADLEALAKVEGIGDKIQKIINGLSLEKFNELLDQISTTFGNENAEIGDMLDTIKELR